MYLGRLHNPVNTICSSRSLSLTSYTHFHWITVTNISVCPKTSKNHPPERKISQTKTILNSLFITQIECAHVGNPQYTVFKYFLAPFLQQPAALQPSQMQSSTHACVLQIPNHCYTTEYNDFLFLFFLLWSYFCILRWAVKEIKALSLCAEERKCNFR